MYELYDVMTANLPEVAQRVALKNKEYREYILYNSHLSYKIKKELVASKLSSADAQGLCLTPLPEDLIEPFLKKEKRAFPLSCLVKFTNLSVKDQTEIYDLFEGKRNIIEAFLKSSHTDFELSKRIVDDTFRKEDTLSWLENIASRHLDDEALLKEIQALGRLGPDILYELISIINKRKTPSFALKMSEKKKLSVVEATALLSSIHVGSLPVKEIVAKAPNLKFESRDQECIIENPFLDPQVGLEALEVAKFKDTDKAKAAFEHRINKGYYAASPADLTYDLFKTMLRDSGVGYYAFRNSSSALEDMGIMHLHTYTKEYGHEVDFSEVAAEFWDADAITWTTIFSLALSSDLPPESLIKTIKSLI